MKASYKTAGAENRRKAIDMIGVQRMELRTPSLIVSSATIVEYAFVV